MQAARGFCTLILPLPLPPPRVHSLHPDRGIQWGRTCRERVAACSRVSPHPTLAPPGTCKTCDSDNSTCLECFDGYGLVEGKCERW